jgi:type I restriction enzyme R subunit
MSDARSYLDPYVDVQVHGWQLPHWQQGSKWYFVTWRLADALPRALIEEWRLDRANWIRAHPKPWDDEIERAYYAGFYGRIERWLDQGTGACLLCDPAMAELVTETLRHHDGERHFLDSFVVMPNHVHVLFAPAEGHDIPSILGLWKSYSAYRINRARGASGRLWQENYWDRMIRHEKHFWATRDYIERNPVKANLRKGEFILYLRDR